MRPLVLAVLTCIMAACSTLQTHTDYDPAVNFHSYHTYAWRVTKPLSNSLLDRRIVAAVDEQLAAKGLQKSEANADLIATYHGSVNERLDIQSFGYGYGGWYSAGVTRTTTVNQVPVGTLLVDLVDAKRNELAWRGTATDDIRSSDSPEDSQRRINDAVAAMFKGFPPHGP